ncbi:MAG: hypothetical protein LBJ80_01465 [Rickettsiales bacterium]|jgi:hypothetical protein|nr:hypothetical protein [Rickettsiales bacterium]MDR1261076.1 hypothetical protein [Rickettsiales bacterium]
MPDQKKFASYAAITIGSAGLIASTIALTMYYSSLSPIILGGIDSSMLPLFGCALLGILSLVNKNLLNEIYDNICGKENVNGKPKPFEEYKILVPAIVRSWRFFWNRSRLSCSWFDITHG